MIHICINEIKACDKKRVEEKRAQTRANAWEHEQQQIDTHAREQEQEQAREQEQAQEQE